MRFVNALDVALTIRPDFAPAQQLGVAGDARVGGYRVVEHVAGRMLAMEASSGATSTHLDFTVAVAGYLTVILRPAPGGMRATPVIDQADYNQARARLVFYNATADCAGGGMGLLPANTPVFADVAPGAARVRSVSPVRATLRATCGGAPAVDLALDGVEAGGSYSIWLIDDGALTNVFLTRDKTIPYKP